MPRVAEVAGIMTGSYIGGGVNFVALKNHYAVPAERANPLIVADNFIMAGMFGLLFLIAGSKFFSPPFSPPALARTRPRAQSKSLAAVWGYVIGTLTGIAVAETLPRWLPR